MSKRILIADDHFAIRSGLVHVLKPRFPGAEFGECVSASEALQKLRESKWDLLILDVEIPGRSGLDLLKQIIYEGIRTPVLVFSFHSEQDIAIRAFRAGAYGYLTKDSAGGELFEAIHQILAGRKYISPAVAQHLASQITSRGEGEPHEVLSDREYQVMVLLGNGKTVLEISDKLALSPSTISTYRARIFKKMGMNTNSELTSYVFRNNLK